MKTLALALRAPQQVNEFSDLDWNTLLREARRAAIMDKLRAVLEREVGLANIPSTVAEVFAGSSRYVAYMQQRLRFELSELTRLASVTPYPIVLLKGAAYIAADTAASVGRGTSDIDILVEESNIADLEERLKNSGWMFAESLSRYDENYYRRWAHELPPMTHPNFQFELDVHHNLLQRTHRVSPKTQLLFESIKPLSNTPFWVLDTNDQIIHSATHLTMGDEMRGGIRDLHDISLMLGQTIHDVESAQNLIHRARDVGLLVPVVDALKACCHHLLQEPLQSTIEIELQPFSESVSRRFTSWLIEEEIFESSESGSIRQLASLLVLARAHILQMPLGLLIKHSAHKLLANFSISRGENVNNRANS